MASSSNTATTSPSQQELLHALRTIDAARDRADASKRRFEREITVQSLFARDLQALFDANCQHQQHSLQRCDALLNVIDDENSLWRQAIQMAGLQSLAVDATYTNALQESSRIVHDLVQQRSEKSQLVSRIDDLIQSLEHL